MVHTMGTKCDLRPRPAGIGKSQHQRDIQLHEILQQRAHEPVARGSFTRGTDIGDRDEDDSAAGAHFASGAHYSGSAVGHYAGGAHYAAAGGSHYTGSAAHAYAGSATTRGYGTGFHGSAGGHSVYGGHGAYGYPGGGYHHGYSTGAYWGGASGAAGQIFMYPKNGQSEEQQSIDRRECQQWAASQAGAGEANSNDYRRAMLACVEGRGYSAN